MRGHAPTGWSGRWSGRLMCRRVRTTAQFSHTPRTLPGLTQGGSHVRHRPCQPARGGRLPGARLRQLHQVVRVDAAPAGNPGRKPCCCQGRCRRHRQDEGCREGGHGGGGGGRTGGRRHSGVGGQRRQEKEACSARHGALPRKQARRKPSRHCRATAAVCAAPLETLPAGGPSLTWPRGILQRLPQLLPQGLRVVALHSACSMRSAPGVASWSPCCTRCRKLVTCTTQRHGGPSPACFSPSGAPRTSPLPQALRRHPPPPLRSSFLEGWPANRAPAAAALRHAGGWQARKGGSVQLGGAAPAQGGDWTVCRRCVRCPGGGGGACAAPACCHRASAPCTTAPAAPRHQRPLPAQPQARACHKIRPLAFERLVPLDIFFHLVADILASPSHLQGWAQRRQPLKQAAGSRRTRALSSMRQRRGMPPSCRCRDKLQRQAPASCSRGPPDGTPSPACPAAPSALEPAERRGAVPVRGAGRPLKPCRPCGAGLCWQRQQANEGWEASQAGAATVQHASGATALDPGPQATHIFVGFLQPPPPLLDKLPHAIDRAAAHNAAGNAQHAARAAQRTV